jgi:hypothetical protein
LKIRLLTQAEGILSGPNIFFQCGSKVCASQRELILLSNFDRSIWKTENSGSLHTETVGLGRDIKDQRVEWDVRIAFAESRTSSDDGDKARFRGRVLVKHLSVSRFNVFPR